MRIGSLSMTPYIYNTNGVSSKSMNKIAAIGDDVTSSKLDVSALVSDDAKKQQNMNPLKPGQSLDFAGILQMQMQMSRMNEARVMQPVKETESQPQEMLKAMPADNNAQTAPIAGDVMAALGVQ
ncbi:MAG: hypothetical protein Q4D29_03055 [Lachnospiraceae bacterium]|nr:hypothetical protein [Lachnospiraceae bacterium]